MHVPICGTYTPERQTVVGARGPLWLAIPNRTRAVGACSASYPPGDASGRSGVPTAARERLLRRGGLLTSPTAELARPDWPSRSAFAAGCLRGRTLVISVRWATRTVLPTMARALGVRDARTALMDSLQHHLEQHALVILDNFEQVLAAASRIV